MKKKYNENYEEQYSNVEKFPEKKKTSGIKKMAFVFIFAVAVMGFLLSPIFAVKTINCTELVKYTKTEICEKIGLSEGMNIVAFKKRAAEKLLIKDPYIESVKIGRSLLGVINIDITERRVRGYVPYMSSYLYIDEYGRVLDTQTYFKETLPVVVGLKYSEMQIGQLLPVSNQESFDVVVEISQLMTKYNLLDLVVKIDVSDPKNIYAYVNKVEIMLGDISDCDEKIRTMAEITKNIHKEDRGTLDLRDMSKPIIFKYLT